MKAVYLNQQVACWGDIHHSHVVNSYPTVGKLDNVYEVPGIGIVLEIKASDGRIKMVNFSRVSTLEIEKK